jgi:hypothetical protein
VHAALLALHGGSGQEAKLLRLALEKQLPDKRPAVLQQLLRLQYDYARTAMSGTTTEIEVLHEYLKRALQLNADIEAEVVGTLLKGISPFPSKLLEGEMQSGLIACSREARLVCNAILDCPWGCQSFVELLQASRSDPLAPPCVKDAVLVRFVRSAPAHEVSGLLRFLSKCQMTGAGLPQRPGQGVREANRVFRGLESLISVRV